MAQYNKTILSEKTKSDLVDIIEDEELDVEDYTSMTKPKLIEAILESYASDEEEDDEEVDDTDDELDDIEEPELDDEEEDDIEEAPKKKSTKKKAASSDDENTLAAKQVASIVGTDAKTIRQFFRSAASTVEAVGSGGRYEFLETDVPKIKSEFETWIAKKGTRGAPGTGRKGKRAAAVTEEIEEVEEIEELEEAELDDLDDDDIELDD